MTIDGSDTQPNSPPRRSRTVEEALQQQPSWIRAELEALRQHETRILEALRDERRKALFMKDPAAVLGELGVKLSGPLRQRLRADPARVDVLRPVAFRLPTGELLHPRINVRFVKARE